MKVAFTSSDGKTIDQHFGKTQDYYVWDVGPERADYLGRVSALASGDEEDRTAARANAIAGCAIVYTVQIGGPAAAKLIARRIHPLKAQQDTPVAEAVSRLQEVLKGSPPPWLKKVMHEEC